ncbi:hypothetical protein M0804_013314 [Polistes exclamans]|nr:hypothetical protein M0804_013314 [Polistes exclamans]
MLLGSMLAEYENFTIAKESRDELPDLEMTKNKQNNYTKHKQGESVKNKERKFRLSGNCYICKKYGHRASDCRYKKANTSQKQNDALAATVLKNDSRKPNVWYLDSSETTHERLDQHRNDSKPRNAQKTNTTAQAENHFKTGHILKFDETKILGKEDNW